MGGKHHTKTGSTTSLPSTYRGALNDDIDSQEIKSSKPPPKEPPPPIPANEKPSQISCGPDIIPRDRDVDNESLPPLYPKPLIVPMAERRIQRQTRNETSKFDSKGKDAASAKRRSRSEGPHGRRRARTSMHETSRSPQVPKHPSDSRHSMFTGHLSDDYDEKMYLAGSDSPETDDSGRKQWTKNPLITKRTKRADKGVKSENRKSLRGVENGVGSESPKIPKRSSREIKNVPNSKKKDLYMYNEKSESSPSSSQKAKFQKLEEMRKKRIDLAVTSDEECSPQLRISRLRQRAMMSSKIFNDNENEREERLNIYPANYRSMSNNSINKEVPVNRRSNYDEPDVIIHANGLNHGDTWNNGVSNMPDNKPPVRNVSAPAFVNASSGGFRDGQLNQQRFVEGPHGGIRTYPNVPTRQHPQSAGVNITSESPPMRSFHEVKSNEPKQLKKAVEKIELNPRSPNSSSEDSLDELIESNIQYLESEIESGKIKRQSGNFSNVPAEFVSRQSQAPVPKPTLSASEEIKARLKGPSPNSRHMATVTTFEPVPKYVHRSNSYSEENNTRNVRQGNRQNVVYLNPNATYSPYMHRKNHEYQDDMSKSDSQLNNMESPYEVNQPFYRQGQHVAPYPVLNQQTGNVIYVQPIVYNQPAYSTSASSLSPTVDAGMFSDVDYNIEVSERIKKWEKKVKPEEKDERGSRSILNTIQEFEHFSDTNQKEAVETPLEIRRELRLLTEHPDTTGVGKLSVNLTGSTSAISDSGDYYQHVHPNMSYNEPKVVSSETNLHRIFRVVQEPRQRNVRRAGEKVSVKNAQQRAMPVQVLTRPNEPQYAQSMSNVTYSETEMGTNAQQTWPPMAIDSDSGVRKSWRVSRYEDELNELKEIVSDNFRDLKKKFDSDASETDTKRETSPVRTVSQQARQTFEKGKPTSLKIESKTRSPAPPRRKHFEMKFTPPASPGVTRVASRFESKREQMKNIPGANDKPVPEVWSPQLESRKGPVSMERVKARTLQTIPMSEDPIWKEMEDLATFDGNQKAAEDIIKEINFDDIDALLELATKGTKALERNPAEVSKAEKLMTSNFTPSQIEAKTKIPEIRPRIMSDPSVRKQDIKANKYFPTPPIKPLKLRTEIVPRKSSASALDEVLEDIRNSLQKKPSDSNSSPNISIQSPRTKPVQFEFPRSEKPVTKVAMNTEELESTLATALQANQNTAPIQARQPVNVPYIDPEFTQYPYIINGNYHLDPSLLSEKLNKTGLVMERNNHQAPQPQKFQQTEPAANKSVKPVPIPVVSKREHASKGVAQPVRVEQQNTNAHADDLDQSVVELKGLAKEVEQKLSQIKSKIVTADEDKLDSVLLALRKFAPMTEQKYFDVKFTPYETDRVKRNKLESALNELEKMYEILDLNDHSLMDRASRAEETSRTVRQNQQRYDPPVRKSSQQRTDNPVRTNYRKSQIEEVERQTQNEFEDITKSFQVLIDEVTKQCHVVAQGSRHYAPELVHVTEVHHSSQPQRDFVRPTPPRRHIPVQTQRSVQDSYNNAIKELESVAKAPPKPVQSAVYVNLNSSVQTKPIETKRIDSAKNLNIQVQSKAVTTRESRSSLSDSNVKTVSSASKVTQPVTMSSKMNISPPVNSAALNQEQTVPKLRAGRFKRRSNPEHRKSMPALTRTVETQTIETQTESATPFQDKDEDLELERQSSLQESSDNSDWKIVGTRKLSGGIAKIVEMLSSSEEEKPTPSKLKHSYSAPDLTAVETFEEIKLSKLKLNIEKRKPSKPTTPRSVKQKREAKLRNRPMRDEINQDDMTSSVTSEDGVMSPTNKPPVYPNWKYPGIIESPPSSKKSEGRQMQVHETVRAVSDTEREPVRRASDQVDIVRRRTRSASDQENTERPRSFHELVATFENDPKRLEKIRMSGLRKCASEDSIFTDLVLQKIYHSDTDLHKSEFGFMKNKSGSGLKLALEIQLKGDK